MDKDCKESVLLYWPMEDVYVFLHAQLYYIFVLNVVYCIGYHMHKSSEDMSEFLFGCLSGHDRIINYLSNDN